MRTIYTTSTGNFPNVPGKITRRIDDQWLGSDDKCIARECAEQICKDRGLPPGTAVPVMISCPCPRCTPRF